MPVGLTTMDRIYLAIIASAVLLLLGAAIFYVTQTTADLMSSRYFHYDDVPGRRLRPDILTSEQAKTLARAERDKEMR